MTPDKSPTPMPTTFHEGEIDGVIFRELARYDDQRGWLVELFRNDEVPPPFHPVMAYVSETAPGVARGPHEHVTQADYFAFIGPGDFTLYMWDARADSPTFGAKTTRVVGESNRCSVIVPPGVVHAYKNTGACPGWVFNAPNQLYAGEGKREPVDEIRHEERTDSVFKL